MPGSIKIDDGSGNYTILTSPTSLGSDKTFTLASPVLQVVEGTDSSAANITDTSYQATGLSASLLGASLRSPCMRRRQCGPLAPALSPDTFILTN